MNAPGPTHVSSEMLALLRAIVDGKPFDGDPAHLPLDLVRHHMLAPLAYSAGVPALRNDYIASSLRAETRDALRAEVLTALADAGVDVILLKGIAYAGSLYPDAAHRPMSDIDLLVRAERHGDAQRALHRLGFWHVGGGFQHSPRHHALGLKRRDGSIDLHRHITQDGRTRIPLADVWARARAAHIPHARRLEAVDEVLFHLAHIARHEFVVPLMSYVDAVRLLHQLSEEQHQRLLQQSATWGLSHAHALLLLCLQRLFSEATIVHGDRFRALGSAPWWLPSQGDLLVQHRGSRLVEVIRKILVSDDLSSVLGLARTTLLGRVDAMRHRASQRG